MQSPMPPVECLSTTGPGRSQSRTRPVSRMARVSATRPSSVKAAQEDGHGEGAGLGIRHRAGGEPLREPGDVCGGRGGAVADGGDDAAGVGHVRSPMPFSMCAAVKTPGRSSATVRVRVLPSVVARVTRTSGPANSAIFWRQPPQQGTGSGLSAMTAISAMRVSPPRPWRRLRRPRRRCLRGRPHSRHCSRGRGRRFPRGSRPRP